MIVGTLKSSGKLWPAGKHIWGLCSAYNHAIEDPRGGRAAIRALAYSNAVLGRIARLGFRKGVDYRWTGDGLLFPLPYNRKGN